MNLKLLALTLVSLSTVQPALAEVGKIKTDNLGNKYCKIQNGIESNNVPCGNGGACCSSCNPPVAEGKCRVGLAEGNVVSGIQAVK